MTFTIAQWQALAPILALSVTIVAVMLAIAFRRHHRGTVMLSVAGFNLALIACIPLLPGPPAALTPLFVVDGYAAFYMGLVLVSTLGTATLSQAYLEGFKGPPEEMYLLLGLAALGGLVLVCSRHLAGLFIGLELLSVPLYAMIGYPVRQRHALEGALKYLVLSATASAFLLFGMALLYAETGTLAFREIGAAVLAAPESLFLTAGGALVLVGLGFKLSLVPFHLWTPDVYQGAPAPVTTFLASASKTAVFAVLLRFVTESGMFLQTSLQQLLTAIAMLTILAGNLLALRQSNVKRMLAYSSVAHFGYCLAALVAGGPLAVEAVGVYLLTYVVTTLGALGVVTLVSSPMGERDAYAFYDYRGLFWRRPYLASILTAMMLSLAGVPATAGFIGKFYVIAAGVEARHWWLVGTVVVGSAIGLYYYLRLTVTLFLADPESRQFNAPLDWAQRAGGAMVLALMVLMLAMGMFPQPFIRLVQFAGLTAP